MENGLLVNGKDLSNARNITPIVTLTEDMVKNPNEFISFLTQEKSSYPARDVSEIVILKISNEEDKKYVIAPFNDYEDENFYTSIIYPCYINGVIDLESLTFTPRDELEFDDIYEETSSFKK